MFAFWYIFRFLHKMYATVIYLPVAKFRGDIPFLCGVIEAFTCNTFFINCKTCNNYIPVKHRQKQIVTNREQITTN